MSCLKTSCLKTGIALTCIALNTSIVTESHATENNYPSYTLTSTEVYDPGEIRAYTGEHKRIYSYIDEHLSDHFSNLQRWVRQPSISAQNVGITEMAELLRDDLAAIG